ncbi:group 1 glycosyl transferase [Nitzschia inconspicua]|uniref:Group 1 glycosyl transferase n=1 Tax=Nitzschia inconspicua TaxID=303405 RepID=A0A9K3PWT4_9STRA|nr:group 1 glycosyl transferase [Nitzschia inconspicua]
MITENRSLPTVAKVNSCRQYSIAMVCDFFYPRLGGVEMHIWSLSQHLIRMGHKVIVITHAYDNRKGVRYMSGPLKVYYCPFIPMTDQDILPTLTATFPLWRQIMVREKVEIVHVHQATSVMSNESVVYAAALGLPSVYTDHSLFQFDDLAGVILNRVLETTLSTLNAAICVSHACRDNLILRAKVDPSIVRVVPNAVDPSKFTPPAKQPSKDRIQVVVVSRLVYRKGVDLLVGIIPKICHAYQHVDFIVGGDGNKLLNLQEMVERERLQHRVVFLGAVPHSNVASVLREGHIFLNCSLTESFCIAILEAASCGLLVVSTNVGGVPEVLEPDMIVLCDPTVNDLTDGLKQAIERQEGNNPVDSHDAHQRIERMYSWHRVALQTIQTYNEIIEQPPKTFWQRFSCYDRLGGLSGFVACVLALYIELWVRYVMWMQPIDTIDVVPDLVPRLSKHNA